ncbi:MAG: Gfo/Idh/MocA family oxidoreductase [Candidatus Hydrogenedentes bacterium]|nr:Gfo/Idh/MocA family oxidoreductase [Candidatus Hydrogenedentota bacterium]
MSKVSRRNFVRTAAVAATGSVVFPRFSIGKPGPSANSKLNIAFVGAGGRGSSNLNACKGENVVALCDVSESSAAKAFGQYPKAKRFKDFRVMMDKMGNEIDAVTVSTPDHTHFAAAMVAMQHGKHVYVEKPLAHSVWQVRTLRKAAHYYNVITQMGNQGHATEGIRYIKEWYDAGVLGEVKEVLAWFSGPNFKGKYFVKPDSFPPKAEPVPADLDWDLWLGPAADRPYNHCYLPFTWRGWYDFGDGELGDWACHTLDGPFWALDLGSPTVVEPELRSDAYEGFVPAHSIIRFEFPARGNKPPVTLRWHDGYIKPEIRPEWGIDELAGSGMLMIGDKNLLMTGGRPDSPKLVVSEEKGREFRENLPEKKIPRVKGGPNAEWIAAIKGEGPMPGSNFDYAARLTEMTLLGVLAQRTNKRIEWDNKKMRITNEPELNKYIKNTSKKGWRYGKEVWKS